MSGPACSDLRRQVDALIDGALDAEAAAAAERHLAACPECRDVFESRRQLVARVRSAGERPAAPEALRRRIRQAVVAQSSLPAPARQRRWPAARLPWWAAGAWAASAAALAASIGLLLLPMRQTPLTEELVGAHVRSMMAAHLIDVESSDRHTVKPWFNGRVDLSPPVPDLADQGFPLVGGRLDYIAERTAAAVVYRRRQHVINLFSWPAPGASPSAVRRSQRNGYEVLTWRRAGIAYAAVSDLNPEELEEFRRLWADRANTSDSMLKDK